MNSPMILVFRPTRIVAPKLHSFQSMLFRRHLFLVFILAVMAPAPALARPLGLRQLFKPPSARTSLTQPAHRQRTSTIRTTISAHRKLLGKGKRIKLPRSAVLSNSAAANKKYADSWTCRASTRMLLKKLSGSAVKLTLDSSGKGAFNWGAEGKVSFHYYATDNPARPTILLDPTAGSNFAADARPGGLLHTLLKDAGRKFNQPKAAERVARRVARGGVDGLLVLANQADITVYRAALEEAARIKRGSASRDIERQ